MSQKSHVFRLVVAAVSPVRTKESIGGGTTVPTRTYVGFRRLDGLQDIGRDLVIIKNIDEGIDHDNYSCFFPSEIKLLSTGPLGFSTTTNPCDMTGVMILQSTTGNRICPRLISAQEEQIQQFEFKNSADYGNHMDHMLAFLSQWGYEYDLLTADQVTEIVSAAINEAEAMAAETAEAEQSEQQPAADTEQSEQQPAADTQA